MEKHVIQDIEEKTIQFFQAHTNFKKNSKGYGLTLDISTDTKRASIAATGFMLSSLVIGVERGVLDKADSLEKAKRTLKTLMSIDNFKGFFAHFLDFDTGKRWRHCEFSTIDTALCLAGVLTVDSYFMDKDIHQMTDFLFKRIDWESFIIEESDKFYLKMAYNPNKSGDYVLDAPGYISKWDMFAEQLLIYPMISGTFKNKVIANKLFQDFERKNVFLNKHSFIINPHNTLFVYHMPLCWLDIKDYSDINKIDWENNAKLATISHQYSSITEKNNYKTFSKNTFGMNASDTKDGYRVFGALPNIENKLDTDGTIAPYSVVCSLPYLYKDALEGINKMKKIEGLYKEYGFLDAYNLIKDKLWVSVKYISIDKGMELLSVNQLTTNIVRRCFMNHPIIKNGMNVLDWKKKY